MIKFCSLFSGSSGNAIFLATDKLKILIDAGLSKKRIEQALISIGENPADLTAILVTHEHKDHIKGVGILSRRYNLPVYANEMTWSIMEGSIGDISIENIKCFKTGTIFEICGLGIEPFLIPHDAGEPVGFSFYYGRRKITVATDIGHVNVKLTGYLEGSDLLLLESNHDIEMLKVGPYPQWLKMRILGDMGHLSNEKAGEVIAAMAEKGTRNFLLGHLSKENNFPELAYQTVYNALAQNNICVGKDVTLDVVRRDQVGRVICMDM
ncbi:MAG: MBL fold metallo-hydrolase [Firmicutes bacterium]|nr:MBL fold metallo-hydrolase [Bacillota bacterium]